MSDDIPLPDDDGAPKFWCFTTPDLPTYQRVAEVPLRRDEAIRRLREQRLPATHATLAEQDLFGLGAMPITPHGTVRVQFTEAEQTSRMLTSVLGVGFTVEMPGNQTGGKTELIEGKSR